MAAGPPILLNFVILAAMKGVNVIFSVLLVLAALALFVWRTHHEPRAREAFDRHPAHLVYTRHAQCRMDCRRISREDIAEIMEKGLINFSKSDRNDRPCPTYALQARISTGENLRVIFAQCAAETKVITCYNLEQDFECHCPGDEKKH